MVEDRLPRKLAAILYADVAAYSRLTGADEDATHRRLAEYLDRVSSQRLLKLTMVRLCITLVMRCLPSSMP